MSARTILLCAALGAFVVTPVFGGVWEDLYQGLQFAATPSGGPLLTAGDGTAVNGARSGRVRIVPNALGQGWRLELDRGFGVDSAGRPETFDLGPAQVTLNGGVSMTADYATRGWLTGGLNTTVSNMNYELDVTNGLADVNWIGTFNLGSSLDVNQFGFYTLGLNASNTSSRIAVDGVLVDDFQQTNFDVGPIFIEGNIFYDAFLGILDLLGVDTSTAAGLTPESPIDRLNQAINDALEEAGVLEWAEQLAGTTQVLPATLVRDDPALEVPGVLIVPPAYPDAKLPEPAALALLAVGGAVLYGTRRR